MTSLLQVDIKRLEKLSYPKEERDLFYKRFEEKLKKKRHEL